jgi:hypothetical protein
MSYGPEYLACMAGYDQRNQNVEEVVVIGTRAPASTATPNYLVTPRASVPSDMKGSAVPKWQFCRTEKGNILSTKATCALSASERDETRQRNCSNVSLSWNGVGWTNPCREDSALTYRTDIARCEKYYQDNTNAYNAICS